jgi:hypothetical protein
MVVLALLMGVILGLRFRIGLVFTASVAVLVLVFGLGIGEGSTLSAAAGLAILCSALTQVTALVVHILKHCVHARAGA